MGKVVTQLGTTGFTYLAGTVSAGTGKRTHTSLLFAILGPPE
jgi:hypothetical protein